jgi:prepilin-type processing-associated H-X9-DG protein
LAGIRDGASQTIMVGERPPSTDLEFGWWYAGSGQSQLSGSGDMVLGVRELNKRIPSCDAGPYSFTPGRLDNQCDMFHFWSLHSGGAHFLMADGSVHFLRYDADPIMPALASRNGGEIVSLPD